VRAITKVKKKSHTMFGDFNIFSVLTYCLMMMMIMNLYSAKSIGEYSKALYIKLKNKRIKNKKFKCENS